MPGSNSSCSFQNPENAFEKIIFYDISSGSTGFGYKQSKLWPGEIISLDDAFGRVLAEDVEADRNYPPFNRAAMDGFAFSSKDIIEKGLTEFELAGELFAGYNYSKEVKSGQCIKIMTGSATPVGLDCVIQVESAIEESGKVKFTTADIYPWQNISKEGEDCRKGDIILKSNTLLNPAEVAILAVLGRKYINVRKWPRVAIFSTGDELVPVGNKVSPFQIRDSNAFALLAYFNAMGIKVTCREIVKDEPGILKRVLSDVIDFDIVVLTGGVSMGAADYVPATLLSLGIEKVFHKISLKPGKPLWFGKSNSGGVFFGLPGNPLSCQVCFKLFIELYIRACLGLELPENRTFQLLSARKKKVKLDEYFPVKLTSNGLEILTFNGSGDIISTLKSTGIGLHAVDSEDLVAGNKIQYLPWI